MDFYEHLNHYTTTVLHVRNLFSEKLIFEWINSEINPPDDLDHLFESK
jgi:hypothetical protein